MTPYLRGADFERRVAAHFRADGYMVVRSAGSRGACDLVAMRAGETPRLVQCRIGSHFSLVHRAALCAAARAAGATAWLAVRGKGRSAIVFVPVYLPADGRARDVGPRGTDRPRLGAEPVPGARP